MIMILLRNQKLENMKSFWNERSCQKGEIWNKDKIIKILQEHNIVIRIMKYQKNKNYKIVKLIQY